METWTNQLELPATAADPGGGKTISPFLELGAYEALWCRSRTSFRTLAREFQRRQVLPSAMVDRAEALEMAQKALEILHRASVTRFGVRVNGDFEYPEALRDARHPVELLYYQGWWNLVEAPAIAVVGTRRPSAEAVQETRSLVRELVGDGWVIVSGLAEGIDTEAHLAAIDAGGRTIAVLGTPLSAVYPARNRELQAKLARECLVISQVPVVRYSRNDYRTNRAFFPERNLTMSALSRATVIAEAGETSGTLIQARGALAQGRKLFILDRCFRQPGLTWPARFEERGAIRVHGYEDIRQELALADQN